MVTAKGNGDEVSIEFKLIGGGSRLASIQRALMLGIELIGASEEHGGDEEFRNAVGELSELLKQSMLNDSQMNIALGGKAYADKS